MFGVQFKVQRSRAESTVHSPRTGLFPIFFGRISAMKRLLALVLVILLAALSHARAEGPDDIYLRIFTLVQDGDTLKANGEARQALAKYTEAQTALQNFQRGYP